MSKIPLVLLLSLPLVACVESQDADPVTEQVVSDLEKENGGFDTADEAPTFGAESQFTAAAIEADVAVADPMASDEGMIEMQAMPGAIARDLAIVWGQMPPDQTATVVRDWTGELRVSRGGIIVRRRIAFEDPGDHLLPRTERASLSFASHTRPHVDGLVLTVVDPTPAATAPLTLTYTPANGTAPYVIALQNLATGPIVIDAGGGNRIVVDGRPSAACDHGSMRGRWRALDPHHGVYLGIVANAAGEPIGHVRGIWGQRQNGERVFFGKFIGPAGHFRGILAGHYENGELRGRWLDRSGDHGVMGGLYFPGTPQDPGRFMARWAETSCAIN